MLRSEVIRPLAELLDAQAEARPDAPALRDERRTVGYRDLAARTASLASSLRHLGVETGEAVGLFMANRTEWVEASFATVRAGAVSVSIPAQATPDDVAFMLADSGARTVFVDADRRGVVLEAGSGRRGLPELRLITVGADGSELGGGQQHAFEELAASSPTAEVDGGRDIDTPSWIVYTSGTTGRPKGVLLTQRGMMWVVAAGWLPFLEWTTDDLILCPLPLTHSYPLDSTLAVVAAGACEFVIERFSPTVVMRILNECDVTVLLVVPTMFSYLLGERDTTTGMTYTRGTLRMCVSAGAVLPAASCDRAAEMFGAPILDAYGATEASTAITMSSWRTPRPAGSCGVSLPGMAMRVVDPASGDDKAPGEEGEVIARGPGIMLGYHERPEETRSTLRNGWYHTGDLGMLDEHGFLTITGRLKDIIIRGGENIAPAEIELVAIECPQVQDCAVVGVEHETLGEVPVLVVVVTGTDDSERIVEQIAQYCRERLPSFKHPERVVVAETVPRTGSGKVMRHKLRELFDAKGGLAGAAGKEPLREHNTQREDKE